MSKLDRFAARKLKQSAPRIDLKRDDFLEMIPEDVKVEIIVHFKAKGEEPQVFNPVHAFAKQGDKFKIMNRTYQECAYTFYISEVKAAYIMPMEI